MSSEPLKVHLRAPRPGWTHQRLVRVQGTVSDKRIRLAHVALNGNELPTNVRNGRFEVRLWLPPGENTLEASARSDQGSARDSVSLYADVPSTDVVVLLTWDTDATDLDLKVTDPSGEECDEGNRKTAAGGSLEVDDTDGYGPEIFALPHAPAGEYHVSVAAYDLANVPETHAEVQVVIRGGTSEERRLSFPITITHEGETTEIGTFAIEVGRH
jgi:uncharacterized protein YfaP (DUF2135 family)